MFVALLLVCLLGLTSAQHRPDYDLLEGHGYYKHHTSDRGWVQAVAICEDEGAHLLIINSQAEITALHDKYRNEGMWVGVRRVDTDDNFVTIFGDSLASTGYSQWYSGFPRGDVTTWPYVGVSRDEGLYNLFSTVTLNFICETEL